MTMVEKIARALARNQLTPIGKAAFDKDERYYTNSFSKEHRDDFEAQARLAIEAMREPTDEMLKVFYEYSGLNYRNINAGLNGMIDAALKE